MEVSFSFPRRLSTVSTASTSDRPSLESSRASTPNRAMFFTMLSVQALVPVPRSPVRGATCSPLSTKRNAPAKPTKATTSRARHTPSTRRAGLFLFLGGWRERWDSPLPCRVSAWRRSSRRAALRSSRWSSWRFRLEE